MGALRSEGSWSEGVRFSRADGSLIGTVGKIADSRANSRDDSRDDSKVEPSVPKKASVDPSQERDALLALKSLEFPAPRAKALLRMVLADQPAARAEELVRGVLRRHSA